MTTFVSKVKILSSTGCKGSKWKVAIYLWRSLCIQVQIYKEQTLLTPTVQSQGIRCSKKHSCQLYELTISSTFWFQISNLTFYWPSSVNIVQIEKYLHFISLKLNIEMCIIVKGHALTRSILTVLTFRITKKWCSIHVNKVFRGRQVWAGLYEGGVVSHVTNYDQFGWVGCE